MLRDPLVVEAIETLFVPVAVRNNSKGDDDARILAAFEEPSWNNPVVRIVDPKAGELGKDLVPRLNNDWSADGLIGAMVAARKAAQMSVPVWLQVLQTEEQSRRRGLERAIFAMH